MSAAQDRSKRPLDVNRVFAGMTAAVSPAPDPADARQHAADAAHNLTSLLRVAENHLDDFGPCHSAAQLEAVDGMGALLAAARVFAGRVGEYLNGPAG